jgi:citrate lyase subunit beta/citryl-CoA lyase
MVVPRPRRSVLFMPGANLRAMEKARGLKADGLIFDLEDSVAPEAKAAARAQIAAAIRQGGYGKRELVLRVNGAGTPWQDDDLRFAATLPIEAVLLPKVDGVENVRAAEAVLASAGAPSNLSLWCMMETPRAFLRAEAIAAASPRLAALVMGTEDLGKELRARARPDRLSVMAALQICVLAARAAGLAVLDSVYRDFNDESGFAAQCEEGRDLGFDGKTLIHPKQIDIANAVFAPSDVELDAARALIAAFDAARAAGKGVATLDGRMIEKLHVDEARRLLALAAAIAALDPGAPG